MVTASKLALNVGNIMNNSPQYPLSIGYNEMYVKVSVSTKFLDNQLDWKNYTDQMIPKLCGACYVVRSVCCVTLIHLGICFAYFYL
jgi:hypothetical protein